MIACTLETYRYSGITILGIHLLNEVNENNEQKFRHRLNSLDLFISNSIKKRKKKKNLFCYLFYFNSTRTH